MQKARRRRAFLLQKKSKLNIQIQLIELNRCSTYQQKMLVQKQIDQLDSMYPSLSWMIGAGESFELPKELKWCSLYGYSFGKNSIHFRKGQIHLDQGQYFSIFVDGQTPTIIVESYLMLICRLGYKCQDTFGWIENQGRLSYIDGCTDSLLIYPPRKGDPSMNLLYFPPGIEQTRHLHPSIRLGCVIRGHGYSDLWQDGEIKSNELNVGDHFCLSENELHRFRTLGNESMTVIAWHPDGDWGPTDQDHIMLNRTYIK